MPVRDEEEFFKRGPVGEPEQDGSLIPSPEPFDVFVRRVTPEHAHLILAEFNRLRGGAFTEREGRRIPVDAKTHYEVTLEAKLDLARREPVIGAEHARLLLAHMGEPVGEAYPEWTAGDCALLEIALDRLRSLSRKEAP